MDIMRIDEEDILTKGNIPFEWNEILWEFASDKAKMKT